jgi:hypothetical protein
MFLAVFNNSHQTIEVPCLHDIFTRDGIKTTFCDNFSLQFNLIMIMFGVIQFCRMNMEIKNNICKCCGRDGKKIVG